MGNNLEVNEGDRGHQAEEEEVRLPQSALASQD